LREGIILTKKPLYLLPFIFITLTGALYACQPAQPNDGTRSVNVGGGAIAQPRESAQSPGNLDDVAPTPPSFNSVVEGDALETDFFGEGTVTYRVNSSALYNGWYSAGLREEELAQMKSPSADDKVLLVSITVENVSVSADSPRAVAALINCFQISLQNPLGHGSIDIAASYFDNPFMSEEGNISEKQYFQYSLPSPGESVEAMLGWVIPGRYASELGMGETYLAHALSGDSLMLNFDDKTKG
jgi:hypothetical protein